MSPVLVVHGGAWAMPDDMVEAHKTGVRNAIGAGWAVLQRGGSALDAVEEAIVILEDDETFDAGRGSFLNREGKVQMDALLMDGSTLRAGGVGCVERVRNPVRAARKILSDSPARVFCGRGERSGSPRSTESSCASNEELVIQREVERLREYQAQGANQKQDFVRARNLARLQSARSPWTAKGNIAGRDFHGRHVEQSSRAFGGTPR